MKIAVVGATGATGRRVELRHRRCSAAVAEELHFARGASDRTSSSYRCRAIKELEEDLTGQLTEVCRIRSQRRP
jgi:hypothetical protein